MSINEKEVREVRGVLSWDGKKSVQVVENADHVHLNLSSSFDLHLTPSAARRLAAQLRALAKRIEQRTDGAKE